MKANIAAIQMLPFIEKAKLPKTNPDFGKDHLKYMVAQIAGELMNGDKAHRWLGFIQGCVVIAGGATVDDMKKLNYSSNN